MTSDAGARRGPLDGLAAALGFLTVVGPSHAPTPNALAWFPVVGAAVGGAVGLVWWGTSELWTPLAAAVLAIAADAALTGALHHDGLADTADGLLPHLDRERRLAVMRQPDVGAFGVTALVIVVLLQMGALADLRPHVALLAGLWCASRGSMAVAARSVPYARSQGLATAFLGGPWLPVALVTAILSTTLAVGAVGLVGAAAVASTVLTAAFVVALARRRLGGFTGDVLGAAGLLGQTVGLLVAAARW